MTTQQTFYEELKHDFLLSKHVLLQNQRITEF